jgi:hydrogenase expression/formation protein HypE
MANEGKMIAVVPKAQEVKALEAMKKSKYGTNAQVIGRVVEGRSVNLITMLKGNRKIDILYGEGLPRIC